MTLHVDVACRLSPAFDLEVSRTFEPGFTILFGTSGSGKTTLLRAIAGLVRPDRGHIGVHDRVLFDSAGRVFVPAPDRRVGYVFQHLALFPHLTVRANIEYGLARMTASEREGRVAAIAGSFGIAHLLDRRPRAISGGERQRVALARSLVTDPELLLLDEPLSALDLPTQSRIIADLRRWNEAHGIPILYVTHAHREAFTLGERAVVLEHGRVIADGVPHQVLDQPGRESLALLAGFENIFDAVVTATHPASGVMECRVDRAGFDIEVPCAPVSAGDTVRLAVRAGDILVATEPPRGLSARNQLPGRIEVLRREGGIMVAHVDVGRVFVVHLTPGAAGSLSLQPGQTIWLVIKTHSFRWLTVS